MVGSRKRYALADTAQQILGGFLLAGPFVLTQEVWDVSKRMSVIHAIATVCLVFAIGYGALYKADNDRDPDREADVAGIPTRFVSLMLVSFGSVAILAVVSAAPATFLNLGLFDGRTSSRVLFTTAKAISVGSIFSVVGAATADTVF